MISLLKSDASLVVMTPVRAIESIRSSNSQHNDSLSGIDQELESTGSILSLRKENKHKEYLPLGDKLN